MNEKIIVDVRSREEFVMGHVKGTVNIPHYDLEYWQELLKDTDVSVYCNTGHRSELAGAKLRELDIPFTLISPEEAEAMEWTSRPMVCAANHVEIKPEQEAEFMGCGCAGPPRRTTASWARRF
jgi:hypothetical protein